MWLQYLRQDFQILRHSMWNQYHPAQPFPHQDIFVEAFLNKIYVRVVSGNAENIQQFPKKVLELLAIGLSSHVKYRAEASSPDGGIRRMTG